MIMRLAPIGAFGAMAFTIGKYGVGTLVQLGQLIICFYITCILFVVVVLGEHRPGHRLQHLQIYPLYPGRAADCAGDLLIRIGAAENARQDGEAGLP